MRFTRRALIGLLLLLQPGYIAAAVAAAPPSPLAWWQEARFGMFIHFGVYSTLARGEWIRSVERISVEAYEPHVKSFNPVDFDARALAKLAKAAGMKYAVMTAKHHDGFCLFNSKLTDYKSMNTPAKRDLVKEFVEAFRAEGLRVGLYYSLIDWHHPDYPHYGDRHHPMRNDEAWKGRQHNFSKYLTYMHGQIKEVVSNYGKLDILWFDFSYDKMSAETWKATELVKMVRQAQPSVLINNRLGGDGESHALAWGDFLTPEHGIPAAPLQDAQGKPLPWETCLTLNNSWGYNRNDRAWKTPKQIVSALANVVSKGGNLLLNVGPDGRGRIPEESVQTLREVGSWMSMHGESIYGAGPSSLPKPDWGRFTQRGKYLYAHVLDQPIGQVSIPGMRDKVKSARLVSDRAQAYMEFEKFGTDSGADLWINTSRPVYHTYPLPNALNTVFELELK